MIAEKEAVPLTADDIAAVNVASELTVSSDDDRPASSYPLLDRRRYRQDDSASLDQLTSIPLAIGRALDFDDNIATEIGLLPTHESFVRSHSSNSYQQQQLIQEVNVSVSSGRKKRKRKAVNEEEDPEAAAKNSSKKREDEDKDPKRHPPRGMSGRRHSGFRHRV